MIHSRSAVLIVLFAVLSGISAQAQSWRFVYMSDHRSSLGHHPGVSTTTVSRLVADMVTNRIDLVLVGGDLIHGDNQPTSGLIAQYDAFKQCLVPLTNAGIPYYAIPGNHEFWAESNSWSQATDAWWQAFGQFLPQNGPTSPCPERGMTYSFNHKSALFLGVNMYTNDSTGWLYKGADTNWVQTQLAGNTKPHVFTFGHVPQTLIASNDATVQTTVDLWNQLAGARCCAYFCGHKHSYQRTLTRAPNGAGYIFEVMDGSGMDVINSNGPPWWGAGNPIAVEYLCSDDTMRGYVLVDVDGLNVSVTRRCFYTNAANEVFWTNMDSFAYTADPGSNWSFAVFGDTRGDGPSWPSNPCINMPVIQAICAAITNDGALCAIVPGDLQHGVFGGVTNTIDNQLSLWTNAVSALGLAGIPYYAIRGNHETYMAGAGEEIVRVADEGASAHGDWMKHIGRYLPTNGPAGEIGMTYSVPYVNALFIGLDTYDGTNDNSTYHLINQDWLDAQLAANSLPHVFVFGHEPAFRAGISCLSEHLAERNQFWDSIGYANARAYLTGHSHVYGRCLGSISNGPALRQLIVGTGGGPLDYTWDGQYQEPSGSGAMIVAETNYNAANRYGYSLVRVTGNRIVMEYRSTTNLTAWTTNDVFAYTMVAMPANVSASHGDYTDKVLVTWNPASDASGYEVWRGTNPATAGRAWLGASAGASFADTTAVPSVHYYYWVRGTNGDGASLYSAFDTGWRNTNGGLPAPGGVAATQGAYTNKVRVSWRAVAGAALYDVYRGLVNDHSACALIAAGQSTELYDDAGTAPGQTNFYWIKARNGGNVSGFSSSAAGYSGIGAWLPPPDSVSASDGVYTDRIAVAWSAVDAASEYEIWRGLTNHSSFASRLAVLTATGYDDVSAASYPGVSFYYWIKARNTASTSDFSASASGYCAPTGATGSADIYLLDFVCVPLCLRPLYHPGVVSVTLGNNGRDSLASPNTRVGFDFYLSPDQTLHDESDLWIGNYQADVQLAPGAATRIILPRAALAGLRMPEVAFGAYYVFAHVRHAAPSTLTDPVPGNNTTMRAGAVGVDPNAVPWFGIPRDYDGDVKADLAVYGPAQALWGVSYSASGYAQYGSLVVGQANGAPAAADYDSDGKMDPGVYRAADGFWTVAMSGSGYAATTLAGFGERDAISLPADFDGDGKADPALYRAADGAWAFQLSSSSYATTLVNGFGGPDWTQASADYDGDGKTDPAIYRAADGVWIIGLSGSSYATAAIAGFGAANAIPVSADYDGDGKADPALYRAADGTWAFQLSTGGYATTLVSGFGGPDCAPVPADYDGDGKADPTCYRQADGLWGCMLSAGGYGVQTLYFGGPAYQAVR